MRKIILAIVLLTPVMASCGGPEFSVAYRYIPPKNNKICLSACERKFSQCRKNCFNERENCLKDVRKRAETIYKKELQNYTREITAYNKAYEGYQKALLDWNNNYRHLYRDYLYFKNACRKTRDYYACERKNQLEEALDTLNNQKPSPPTLPQKPDLSTIISELSSSCPKNCGCREIYDSCFTSCGGDIVPYKFCTKNCK